MSESPVRMVMLARVPRYGYVKSRLARHAGKPTALRAHVALLAHNASIAAATGLPFELHYAGDASNPFFSALAATTGAALVPQAEGDIGVRMLAAARYSSTSSPDPSIVIGSDCGALSVGYLESAVAALSSADVVLGPAEDGGYVLVGQRKPVAPLEVRALHTRRVRGARDQRLRICAPPR